MIDTEKYEGHTPAPWDKLSEYCPVGSIDKQLIADAPLLLQALIDERAEVKRLTAMLEETIHHLDLMVGAFGIESLVEMVGEEE